MLCTFVFLRASSRLMEKIRQQLHSGSFARGIYVTLKKTFDTTGHDNFNSKLNFYNIREVDESCFLSNLQNELQYASINSFNSDYQLSLLSLLSLIIIVIVIVISIALFICFIS